MHVREREMKARLQLALNGMAKLKALLDYWNQLSSDMHSLKTESNE